MKRLILVTCTISVGFTYFEPPTLSAATLMRSRATNEDLLARRSELICPAFGCEEVRMTAKARG